MKRSLDTAFGAGGSSASEEDTEVSGVTVDQIRHLALAAGQLEEVLFNAQSRIISFIHKLNGCRINVYYTTGTVGTAVTNPPAGPAAQMFTRRTTLVELLQLFLNPNRDSENGYYTKQQREAIERERAQQAAALDAQKEEEARRARQEAEALALKLREEEERKAREQRAAEELARALAQQAVEEEARRKAAAAAEAVLQRRREQLARGVEVWARLSSHEKYQDEFLKTIDEDCTCVAIYEGYFGVIKAGADNGTGECQLTCTTC